MISTMLKWIKTLFSPPTSTNDLYELVEAKTKDGGFEQGIRLLQPPYNGIIVTTSPKVSIREVEGELQLCYDVAVRANPNNIQYQYEDLHRAIGPILVDIISKDYNATGRDNSLSLDEGQ